MVGFVIRRVLWLIPVLFVVSLITFTLMHAVPGGPWDREKPLNAGTVARLNEIYGLNKPIWEQYLSWFGGMLQLDFGPSYQYRNRTVNDILSDGWPITVQLGVMTFIVAIGFGIPLGIFAALGHNRWPDYVATRCSASRRRASCSRSC
ncbi:MAG: ABC transporter permease [Chloroflexi bacterium]|nr:MAG: ABC transporter permease [Chloroflexota bacterium]